MQGKMRPAHRGGGPAARGGKPRAPRALELALVHDDAPERVELLGRHWLCEEVCKVVLGLDVLDCRFILAN